MLHRSLITKKFMPRNAFIIAFTALTLWLLGNWIGVHGHFCFDGQEPPVSVHVHLDGHTAHDHYPDEEHTDADVDLLQLVIAKLSKIDLGLVLLAVLSLLLTPRLPRPVFVRYLTRLFHSIPYARPLLRAPPLPA